MTDPQNPNEETTHRSYAGPYTAHHPVPTVQNYKERRENRKAAEASADEDDPNDDSADANNGHSKLQNAVASAKKMATGQNPLHEGHASHPYLPLNRNEKAPEPPKDEDRDTSDNEEESEEEDGDEQQEDSSKKTSSKDSKQMSAHEASTITDPKQKRKAMKKYNRQGGRQVTDPVTHLPVTIYDNTDKDLRGIPENAPPAGSNARTATGISGATKSQDQLHNEETELQNVHDGMQELFPPPSLKRTQERLVGVYKTGITRAVGALCLLGTTGFLLLQLVPERGRNGERNLGHLLGLSGVTAIMAALGIFLTWFVRAWMENKAKGIWEDAVWTAARAHEKEQAKSETPESTQWLNSLLASIWPLINPDLFTSLADTLEDVMQASLPKAIRMISVDDLGQGSESLRILGVRWLPTGAAAQSVSKDGKLKPVKANRKSDRTAPGEGEIEHDTESGDEAGETESQEGKDTKGKEEEEENIAEGLEGEQGDFVNMELAFAYRASSSGKSLRTKAKNAHLYLNFYLPAGIRVPVWVEMRGIIGVMRLRLQLTPDPPFFSLATITFLGQPKADMSCVPLNYHAPNIMDVPFISSFVQSAIDAALAEYVAPKSLTLDLKNMLVGDDFKKDTIARGIVVVRIKRAREFKEGDGNLGGLRKGSSDPYVTVGWSKFGKPVFASRVILDTMQPEWHETAMIIVTPEEVNAEERLRIQLWDSDKSTADDDLGRTEVGLKELMAGKETNGKMVDHRDDLCSADVDEKMPGWIEYSIGYFRKTHITKDQLDAQTEEEDVQSQKDLKEKVDKEAERKLREAGPSVMEGGEASELAQQKAQDFKEREDNLLIGSPPPSKYCSGIFSIQIHQITGLELESIQQKTPRHNDAKESSDEQEDSDDLPSSYCNIIINHSKVYKTRTKPKNAKPFFNAGTERFIRDWRSTEVMLSVRDSRVHENDPLLGIVYLPLSKVFEHRSQVIDSYPLVGGIGYGRARVSMVFRALKLELPRELQGWDYGTLEFVDSPWIEKSKFPQDFHSQRITARTSIDKGKLVSSQARGSDEGDRVEWSGKHNRSVCLAVRKRYATSLVLEFRNSSALGTDRTTAFAILWLRDIPDDEATSLTLPVYKNHDDSLKIISDGEIPGQNSDLMIGEIHLQIKFWHGLSGFHKGLAGRDANLRDVFEVLETAEDNEETDSDCESLSDHVDTSESSSSSSDEDGDDGDGSDGRKRQTSVQRDGSRNPIQQARDYKQHHRLLHRQHRGIMQWKGPRSLDWMKTKADHGRMHLMDRFRHDERDAAGIETEV